MFTISKNKRRFDWIESFVSTDKFDVKTNERASYSKSKLENTPKIKNLQAISIDPNSAFHSNGSDSSLETLSCNENSVSTSNSSDIASPENLGPKKNEIEMNGAAQTVMAQDHVVLQLGSAAEQKSPTSGPSKYLHMYYDMMYYFGTTTYKIGWNPRKLGSFWRALSAIQKLAFWSISILSGLQSFFRLKSNIMHAFSDDSDVEYRTFVSMAYNLVATIAKVYIAYLFSYKQNDTDQMLRSMEEYEDGLHLSVGPTRQVSGKTKLVIFLALATLLVAGVKPIILEETINTEVIIVEASQELLNDILIWNPNTMQNDSDKLAAEFGEDMTSIHLGFGLVSIFRNLASNLQIGMFFDLIIVMGIVISTYARSFMKKVKNVTKNVPKEDIENYQRLQTQRESVWRLYQLLKSIDANVNNIFDPLFKLLHIRNLLSYAFFMALVFFRSLSWTAITFFGLNLVKAEIGYVIAGRIAEVNGVIRIWIRNWALNTGKIVVDGEEMDVGVLLDELDTEPIGFGKGKFLIHESFHYKFLGLVGSVFFAMADEEKT